MQAQPCRPRMDCTRDITAGMLAGILGKTVEQPFDTVKVLLQGNGRRYSGYADCVAQTARSDGLRGFYKGLPAPLAGAMVINGVQFTAYGEGLRLCRYFSSSSSTAELPLAAKVCAGCFAGFVVVHVSTPVELVKCRMQFENSLPVAQRQYKNTLHCARSIVTQGGIRSLYRGHVATLARGVPGNGAYYGFYNLALYLFTPQGKSKADLERWKVAVAGAAGGVGYWTIFFPGDVVKTRMQTSEAAQKHGLWKGLVRLYTKGGVRGLYAGYLITALRAIPTNAVIFSVYEFVASAWDSQAAP